MSSLLESKLTAEASSFSGETSGAVARSTDSATLPPSELQNVQAGGARRRRRRSSSSKKSAKRVAKRSRGSRRKSRRTLRSLFSF